MGNANTSPSVNRLDICEHDSCLSGDVCMTADIDVRDNYFQFNHNQSSQRNSDHVREWLKNMKLSEYFVNFIENGFDDLRFIQHMDRNLLQEIGITKLGHQQIILSEIRNLQPTVTSSSPFYLQIMSNFNGSLSLVHEDHSPHDLLSLSMDSSMSTLSIASSMDSSSLTPSHATDDTLKCTKRWICNQCQHQNAMMSPKCQQCGLSLNVMDEMLVKYLNVSPLKIDCVAPIDCVSKWECAHCYNVNLSQSNLCLKCGSDKYDSTSSTDSEGAYKYAKVGINV